MRETASQATRLIKRQTGSNHVFLRVAIGLPLAVALVIALYAFSMYYLQAYYGGDQYWYRLFWDRASDKGIFNTYRLQRELIGAAEPLFTFVIWLGSRFLHKDTFISLANIALILLLGIGLRRLRVSLWIYPLIFTNYYLFVLLFAAERLKFAVIVVLLAALSTGGYRVFFATIAPLFHFQVILLGAQIFANRCLKVVRSLFRGRVAVRSSLALVVLFAVLVTIFVIFRNDMIAKFYSYNYQAESISELYKGFILAIIGIVLAKDKAQAIFTYLPLFIAAYLLTGAVINVVFFVYTIIYSFQRNAGLNILGIPLLAYFSVQGLEFLSWITTYGTGYPGCRFAGC